MGNSSRSGIITISLIVFCFMIFMGCNQGKKHDAAVRAALEEMDARYVVERRQQEGLFTEGVPVEMIARTNRAAKEAGFSPEKIREKAAKKFDREATAERYEKIRAEEKRQKAEIEARRKKAEELLRRN